MCGCGSVECQCGAQSCGCGKEECSCGGSCECGGFERKVFSTEEKIQWFKDYQKELELELTAVKEKIAHLEGKKK